MSTKDDKNFEELLEEVKKIGERVDESTETLSTSLSSSDVATTATSALPPIPVDSLASSIKTDDNLQDYVYKSAETLINSSLGTLEKVRKSVTSAMDHRELTALAELIKATTSTIEILNKMTVENKKIKSAKEIKKMDIEAKKEIGASKNIKTQNNIMIATREEVLKQLINKTIKADDVKPIIDIEEEKDDS